MFVQTNFFCLVHFGKVLFVYFSHQTLHGRGYKLCELVQVMLAGSMFWQEEEEEECCFTLIVNIDLCPPFQC